MRFASSNWLSPEAASASPPSSMTPSKASFPTSSIFWASSRSRTFRSRFASTACATSPSQFRSVLSPVRRLANKPSIAVLPFVNMSGDHAHDYLSDGITENIITGLSLLSRFVSYRQSIDVCLQREGAENTGCGERAPREIRARRQRPKIKHPGHITAQLIDGLTGAHLWAERFDRMFEDIATVLDDLTEIIVARLATTYGGRLSKAWRGRAERTSPKNFQAYDYFQQGVDAFNLFTKGCTATAIQWFEKLSNTIRPMESRMRRLRGRT